MRSHRARHDSETPKAARDLRDRLVALAGDRDHLTAEHHRERLGHDVDPSSEERVLTGQESTEPWAVPCTHLGITPKRTRPYRPQTNGKIERFHRTLAGRWAFARPYTSESQRRDALPGWLHMYNHHRPHTAIGRQAPITRLTNVLAQYN
jgi:transposase InsO family protein